MDNNSHKKTLPHKVVRRHIEMIDEIIPDFSKLVIEENRPADTLLNRFLRSRRELGSRDRRFLSQAVFSYFRWYGWSVARLGLDPCNAVMLGTLLDSTELSPSFSELKTKGTLPGAALPIGELSIGEKRDRVNEWFADSLQENLLTLNDLVPADFETVIDPRAIAPSIAEFQHRPPVWIRSRVEPGCLTELLNRQEISCRTHEQIGEAIAVESGTNLNQILNDQSGQFIVQDISSQCVALACSPSPGEEWWDSCAGAGGKSLHLMDLMNQDGRVLASDVRLTALRELKKRARRHGIRNIRTQPFNAALDEPFRKTFDGVLVDAPCSGWGTWGRNPDARWRTSRRDVTQCANRQQKILGNTTWCVKPGGVLVYAVCTMTRPETEEIVMNFLEQHPNFQLEPFTNPLTGQQTDGQVQVWPWDGPGDAMFIARFRREAE